jgi:hypothetical protein
MGLLWLVLRNSLRHLKLPRSVRRKGDGRVEQEGIGSGELITKVFGTKKALDLFLRVDIKKALKFASLSLIVQKSGLGIALLLGAFVLELLLTNRPTRTLVT